MAKVSDKLLNPIKGVLVCSVVSYLNLVCTGVNREDSVNEYK